MRVLVLLSCIACGSVPVDPAPAATTTEDGGTQDPDPGATEADAGRTRPGNGLDGVMGSLCDRDRDGFRAIPPPCNGNDCDDTDPRAHPGQDFLTDLITDPLLGDWNCDDELETQYKGWFVVCEKLGESLCGKASGFLGSPDCGEIDTYVHCGLIGNACAVMSTTVVRQACR